MIAIDASALIAILSDEPERSGFNKLIESEEFAYISAASLLETRIVLFSRFGDDGVLALDSFLLKSGITVVEVSPRMGALHLRHTSVLAKGQAMAHL